MRAAVLVYHGAAAAAPASLIWAEPLAGRVHWEIPVVWPPNVGVFPQSDCALVSYLRPGDGPPHETLDVYRLSDSGLRARLVMDCRAHFNLGPRWSTFLPGPGPDLVYVYKSATVGNHQAEDYVCGLRLDRMEWSAWTFRVPECVAGWSLTGGRAHAQFLFVADGVEVGRLPADDLQQKVGFWLGPEQGMGPVLALGPRPRLHSDLGHARAILAAPQKPLSVVVCNDGTAHLLDPVAFRPLERQRVAFPDGQGMTLFAAQLDPAGRFLYVGTGGDELRCAGRFDRIVVHDLTSRARAAAWQLDEPLSHLALSPDGCYLCGSAPTVRALIVLDTQTGEKVASLPLDGIPRFVLAAP